MKALGSVLMVLLAAGVVFVLWNVFGGKDAFAGGSGRTAGKAWPPFATAPQALAEERKANIGAGHF